MKHRIVTQWVKVESPEGPIWKPKARVDIGLYAPQGQYGDPTTGPCYMECDCNAAETAELEAHPETIILHSLDDDGQERSVPGQTAARAKLVTLGVASRDLDGLSWNNRRVLAQEIEAVIRGK